MTEARLWSSARTWLGSLAVLGAVSMIACTTPSDDADADRVPRIRALRAERDALRSELAQRMQADLLISATAKAAGDVVIALDTEFLKSAIASTAACYLDRVELDLGETVAIDKGGDAKVKVPFGRVKAGRWNVSVSFPELGGSLRAGQPWVAANMGYLDIAVPVRVEGGGGAADIVVKWDANFVSGFVCGDFSHAVRAEGTAVARDYLLTGRLVLESSSEGPRVRTELDNERIHLEVELTETSYERLREIVRAQREQGRCRLVLDEADIESKIREFVGRGFRVPLPRELQRSLALPTRYAQRVDVLGRSLAVEVRAVPPTLDPLFLWSGASVELRASEGDQTP